MRLESFALRNRKTKSWLERIVAISSINLIVSYNESNLELRRCDRDRKKKEIARNLSENLPFGEACHARFSPICVANIFALYSSITAVRARERESTHLANRVTIVTGFSRSRDLTYRSIRCLHGIKLIWTCVHFFSPFYFFSLSPPPPLSLSNIRPMKERDYRESFRLVVERRISFEIVAFRDNFSPFLQCVLLKIASIFVGKEIRLLTRDRIKLI